MHRIYLLFILLFALVPYHSEAQESPIKRGDVLSLQKCVEISLKNHPSIISAVSTVRATQARIDQARANYYPQINWSSGYNRNSAPTTTIGGSGGIIVGVGPYDQYSSAVTLSQNIYDFGKTSTQVKIQSLTADSSRYDLDLALSQLVFTVKQAYYDLLQAKINRDVAADTVSQFQQHLDQAEAFFRIGTKAKIDVTKAEVDLSNAKLNLLTAENVVGIAKVTLNNAMGIPSAPEYTIESQFTHETYPVNFEEVLKKAYGYRPDLLSLIAKRDAADKSIDLAKTGYYPTLSGDASYGRTGGDFPLAEDWTVGATLSFPLFSGFLTKYQVEEAKANLSVFKANEESLRQSIRLDVEQAYLNLKQAELKIPTSEIAVKQADENNQLAGGRYQTGVGSPIEVTDALVALSNAKTAYTQALHDYKIAQAAIEKAMGMK
ncbi:MAG: TolC family protein [Syntrophales bacterium]